MKAPRQRSPKTLPEATHKHASANKWRCSTPARQQQISRTPAPRQQQTSSSTRPAAKISNVALIAIVRKHRLPCFLTNSPKEGKNTGKCPGFTTAWSPSTTLNQVALA